MLFVLRNMLLLCLNRAVLSTKSALRWRQQFSSREWSWVHQYGLFQLTFLFSGDHSPFISREMPCLWLPASLQVLTVIRASFLFSSGLAGQYDCCQAPAEVETNYRWRHGVSHQHVFFFLIVYVYICLYPLAFSLNPWQFKWIYAPVCHSHRCWDKMFHMNLSVSLLCQSLG